MFRFPKPVLAVGGAALTMVLLTLAAPRTVHAVAAALVEVTNTSSNPVVTQTTGAQAANMIHLQCGFNMDYKDSACFQITSTGVLSYEGPNIPYTVPNGSYLVITAADVAPSSNGGNTPSCPGVYYATIGNNTNPANPINFLTVTTSNNLVTTHFTYPPPSGIVIAPGTGVYGLGHIIVPTTGQFAGSCSNFAYDVVDLYGYLTTN
jgi:hypothetical protein